MLGIAIGDKSLVVAEASRGPQGPRVTLAASFAYLAGAGLDQPEALGASLAAFLKDKGFTARQAVVGVPARWVLSKPKEAPPADPATVAEVLRLQVEGEFSQELKDLAYDFAGETDPADARPVLLVAMQGKHLTQVKALAAAARLNLSAVTPVGCVLGAATATAGGRPRHALVVTVGPGGVELAAQDGATPRVLRHLGASAAAPALLAGALRRATFAFARPPASDGNGAAANGNGSSALVLWDGSALSDVSRLALADAAGLRMEHGDLDLLGVPAGLSAAAPDLAGAAALAVAGASDDPLAADFLHSKLAAPKRPGLPRRVVVGALAAAAVLLVVAWAWTDLTRKQNELAVLQDQVARDKPNVDRAKAFVSKVGYAQAWHQDKPRFLACLRDVALAVPEDGQTFLTRMNLHDNMRGNITGTTTSEANARKVADQLRAFHDDQKKTVKRFAEVKFDASKSNDTRAGDVVTFTVNFVYVPEK